MPTQIIRFGGINPETEKRGEFLVDLDTGSLSLAGSPITIDQWTSAKKRVDAVLRRVGSLETERAAETPRGTKFILGNLPALNRIKKALAVKAGHVSGIVGIGFGKR